MKKVFLALFCGPLGILVTTAAVPRQVNDQTEISKEKLVNTLRLLNTQEYVYRDKNGRFAPREEMLDFLKQKNLFSRSPIDLESPQPYELILTTSTDGMHDQITLQRPGDMNDKTAGCKTAAFTDDRGVIFLGQDIGCESASHWPATAKHQIHRSIRG